MNYSEIEILTTKDGSHTLFSKQFNEIYHSRNGAMAESVHVFIEAGLNFVSSQKKEINILEVGFDTGLNALLSLEKTLTDNSITIHYTGLEPIPVHWEILEKLNYIELLSENHLLESFKKIHLAETEKEIPISPHFSLFKSKSKVEDFKTHRLFDLIYFDAFAPATQPELWTLEIFEKIYGLMSPNAALVTYCAKGEVKRNLKQAGFEIQPLPGPIGKREMTRALKSC